MSCPGKSDPRLDFGIKDTVLIFGHRAYGPDGLTKVNSSTCNNKIYLDFLNLDSLFP